MYFSILFLCILEVIDVARNLKYHYVKAQITKPSTKEKAVITDFLFKAVKNDKMYRNKPKEPYRVDDEGSFNSKENKKRYANIQVQKNRERKGQGKSPSHALVLIRTDDFDMLSGDHVINTRHRHHFVVYVLFKTRVGVFYQI